MARVLVYSADVIGEKMAGPAIRYWEFARALARNHDVTLAIPNEPLAHPDGFNVQRHDQLHRTTDVSGYDAVVSQTLSPTMARQAHRHGTKLILDEYDPIVLEVLERYRDNPMATRTRISAQAVIHRALCISVANSIVCASERQRDLLIGAASALGLISPELYERDRSLRSYIDVVPFGLPSAAPQRMGPGPRARFGLSGEDFVILWGGGIWEWFDPLTPIRAVAELAKRRDDIKLVFMGLRNPDPGIEEMSMTRQAIQLADDLGVKGRHVFFNEDWIPYEARANYLLDANIGLSAHFNHLETTYAFRTRMLDYLWADLPIISTVGDAFAELIDSHEIGRTVPYEDVGATVRAIEELAGSKDRLQEMKAKIRELKKRFEWGEVIRPLERHIAEPGGAPSIPRMELYRLTSRYFVKLASANVSDEGVWRTGRRAASYLMNGGTQ